MCLLNDLVTHTHSMKIMIVKLTKSIRPQATREQSQERNLRQIRQIVRSFLSSKNVIAPTSSSLARFTTLYQTIHTHTDTIQHG